MHQGIEPAAERSNVIAQYVRHDVSSKGAQRELLNHQNVSLLWSFKTILALELL